MATMTRIVPTFLVADVIASAEHYRDALGFSFDRFWGDPPQFVFVERDEARIGLMQAPIDRLRKTPTGFADATIYVDGRRIDDTPIFRAPMTAGRHVLRAVLADGRSREQTIVIAPERELHPKELTW